MLADGVTSILSALRREPCHTNKLLPEPKRAAWENTVNRLKLLLIALAMFSASAHAGLITYTLQYSGASFGNGATATGSVTLDITLSGAEVGNGTFDRDDLGAEGGRWVWTLDSAIDLTTQLVGQVGFVDFNWLCEINNNECTDPLVPQGVNVRTIEAESGERLLLTSMQPVPLPGAVWLFGSALAGLAVQRRRAAV